MGIWTPGPGPTDGDDTYEGDGNIDLANGGGGNDTLNGNFGDDLLSGDGFLDAENPLFGNDVIHGGAGVDVVFGGAGVDTLFGDDGDDYLVQYGGLEYDFQDLIWDWGADIMDGGAGIDVGEWDFRNHSANVNFTMGASNAVTSITIGGNFSGSMIRIERVWMQTGSGNDTLTGGADGDYFDGGDGADILSGMGGDDVLYASGAGHDTLIGGAGNDQYYVRSDNWTITEAAGGGVDDWLVVEHDGRTTYNMATDAANVERFQYQGSVGLTVTGAEIKELIITGSGDDAIYGGGGDDVVYAREGADTVYGGAGNDNLSGDFTAGVSGPDGDDVLIGGLGADGLYGGDGDDTVSYVTATSGIVASVVAPASNTGDAAGDTYADIEILVGSNFNDVLTGGAMPYSFVLQLYGGAGNDALNGAVVGEILSGGAGSDTLDAAGGSDVLDGGSGVDTMAGGDGDDTYYVDNAGDTVTETSVSGGSDYVYSSVNFTLGANVEKLRLQGSDDVNGAGNGLANAIAGNSGANIIDGKAGADAMNGGAGDDTYYVDNTGDVVIETSATGGIDYVYASVNFTLGANVEKLRLQGSGNIKGVGNAQNNAIAGNSGANILDGKEGADEMSGGAGDDTYGVDNAGDVVKETSATGGTDQVNSYISYTLGMNVERLSLRGGADLNGFGNALNNVLMGNSGANVLDGKAGADAMSGGAGDDTYYVDNAADTVTESSPSGGIDYVYSSVNFVMGANVEKLRLTGSANLNAEGNALDNAIAGNGGANIIDGKAGADTMSGGAGDDTYIVDNAGDVVKESAGGGNDHINASVSLGLGANVETLSLEGSANLSGAGNALDNTILGNDGENVLSGGLGLDFLTGGAGDDLFRFDTALSAANIDTVTDFTIGADALQLDIGVFSALAGVGELTADEFHTGSAAHDATDRILYDAATGALYYDADGDGAGDAAQFATLSAGLGLTNADIFVI